VERPGVRLEDPRGGGQELLAELARGLEHGVARHVELTARGRGAGERGEGAVGDVDGHALERDAEDFGGDLAERRPPAPAPDRQRVAAAERVDATYLER